MQTTVLSGTQMQAAADLLLKHWRGGTKLRELPEQVRPKTREEGYGIQALVEKLSAHPLFGWKIAATSQAGQAHIGVDAPLAGRLLAEHLSKHGEQCPLAGNQMKVFEAEFAFRMGRDLPPRPRAYTVAEVLRAVDALHPAIEIPNSRFLEFERVGAAQLIADNACAHRFVLGPEAPSNWRHVDLRDHKVMGIIEGKSESVGTGANVLSDPRLALTWLANELSGLGVTLRAGQIVTTGTRITPMAIASGDRLVADFGTLGSVRVSVVH